MHHNKRQHNVPSALDSQQVARVCGGRYKARHFLVGVFGKQVRCSNILVCALGVFRVLNC